MFIMAWIVNINSDGYKEFLDTWQEGIYEYYSD